MAATAPSPPEVMQQRVIRRCRPYDDGDAFNQLMQRVGAHRPTVVVDEQLRALAGSDPMLGPLGEVCLESVAAMTRQGHLTTLVALRYTTDVRDRAIRGANITVPQSAELGGTYPGERQHVHRQLVSPRPRRTRRR